MSYIGIDPSLTGFAMEALPDRFSACIRTSPRGFPCFPARLEYVLVEFERLLTEVIDRGPIELAAIEGPARGQRRQSMADEMAAVHQIARLALWRAGVPYVEVPPSTLKLWISGSGSAEKSLMLREVYKRWNYEAADDNAADAYALARLAEHWHMGALTGEGAAGRQAIAAWKKVVGACTFVEARG